jgi:hypothetical protein
VLDDDDLLGAKEVLADDQRAHGVVACEAARLADVSMQATTASFRPGGNGRAERSNWAT